MNEFYIMFVKTSELLVFMMSPWTSIHCKLFVLDLLVSEAAVLDVLQSIVHIKLAVSYVASHCSSHTAWRCFCIVCAIACKARSFRFVAQLALLYRCPVEMIPAVLYFVTVSVVTTCTKYAEDIFLY